MKVKNIVKNGARVERIVDLSPGDCIKILSKDDSEKSDELLYAVVDQISNNGDDTVVSMMQFSSDWNDRIHFKPKHYSGERDVVIFMATKEEITANIAIGIKNNIKKNEREIEDNKARIEELKNMQTTFNEIIMNGKNEEE